MRVIDHEPYAWFLLADGDRHYLDALVTRSAVDWSVLIELSGQEECEYHTVGRTYLTLLAAQIHNFAENYAARDLTQRRGHDALAAISEWRGSSSESE